MTFGEKLVMLRKIKGLTQDEFGSAVGVSRQSVCKWETGKGYPEAMKLVEIKMILGISIDDLLDENYEVTLPEKKKKVKLSRAETKKIEESVRREMEAEEKPAEEETPAEEPAPAEKPAEEVPGIFEKSDTPPAVSDQPTQKEKQTLLGRLFGKH